jgi:hypothetical protein
MAFSGRTQAAAVVQTSPDAAEKRRVRRHRVLLTGKISYGARDFALDCSVRDLSDRGARICVPDAIALPQDVSILILREGLVCHGEVIWSESPLHGVAFHAVDDVRTSAKPELAHFKHLWKKR